MRLHDLFEAISLSQAKPYRAAWNPSTYAEMFRSYARSNPAAHADRNAFRLTIPVGESDTPPAPPPEIEAKLKTKGYSVKDYAKGLATDGRRDMRIGRLIADDPALLKLFTNDARRAGSKTAAFLAVISRHPYDVAGMSTGRGWSSCMNITDGSNRHYVMADVEGGTIIAYLVAVTDPDVRTPLGRVLIKPFRNVMGDDVLLVRSKKTYGTVNDAFLETVDAWLLAVNGVNASGLYCMDHKLYRDDGVEVMVRGKDQPALADYIKNHCGFTQHPDKTNWIIMRDDLMSFDFEFQYLANPITLDNTASIMAGLFSSVVPNTQMSEIASYVGQETLDRFTEEFGSFDSTKPSHLAAILGMAERDGLKCNSLKRAADQISKICAEFLMFRLASAFSAELDEDLSKVFVEPDGEDGSFYIGASTGTVIAFITGTMDEDSNDFHVMDDSETYLSTRRDELIENLRLESGPFNKIFKYGVLELNGLTFSVDARKFFRTTPERIDYRCRELFDEAINQFFIDNPTV